jgi:hypothetical protein
MLLSGVSMGVSIGTPIAVERLLDKRIIKKDISSLNIIRLRDSLPSTPLLRSAARRLTDDAMASIYRHTQINWDHLAAYLIEYHPNSCFSVGDLANRMCLALEMSSRMETSRIHP